jgi:ribonuclease G
LPWFRWLKKKEQEEALAASQQEEDPAPAEPDEEPEDEAPAPEDGEAPKKKRRRGSRGGRGRKKKAPAEAADVAAEQPAEEPVPASKKERAKTPSERRGGRQPGRRRQAPRRAPLPSAKRELLIAVDVGEQRVAVLEDDRVAEVYLERPERRSIAGNIYLGTVDNVLPGMEAAFVEIGLEKNGFLYVDEIVVPELEGKRHGKKITDLIQRGQTILVQAVKDPMKTKGARLTTEISLPGRFLVYVPLGEGLGVSRRLEDQERQRLKDVIRELDAKDGGIIVRTAADGASAEDIERDLVFLQRLWKTIQARAKAATAPELVYQEAELPLRIVRDLFAGDFEGAHVDNDRTYKRIVGYLKKTSPHMLERVHRYKEREPLFARYGVDAEIASTLSRRVDLPSGGYLIFDYAEAFTVIDVNTGRFVGSRSKNTTQRLEDTIVKNNLEAVKEVVRQLRLRDIGGIIVIDFIDMANPKNRASVEEALRTELERDRTKTYVVEISPLGLVEMTRQNVTDGPREILTRRCPTCDGDGIVVSDQTHAMLVERKLRELAQPGNRVQAYKVAVHPRILALVAGPGGSRLAEIEEAARRRFFLVPAEGHVHGDAFEVLAEGKLDSLRPESSLEEGAELELKLAQVDLHDPTSAVAKLDGTEVVVADAAKLVGKKATVHIGRVLDGQALATLVGPPVAPAAITFESEAEKPTRAPRRKAAEEAAPALDEALEIPETTDEDAGAAPEEEAAETAAADGDGAAAKKRTRRGSRGGRRRKKPVAAAGDGGEPETETQNGPEPAVEAGEAAEGEAEAKPAKSPRPARKRQPKIHVPIVEPAAESAPETPAEALDQPPGANGDAPAPDGVEEAGTVPKKRARRGSRGGRGRKKASSSASAEATEPAAEIPPETRVVVAEAPTGGYVPMSEWIDDLER